MDLFASDWIFIINGNGETKERKMRGAIEKIMRTVFLLLLSVFYTLTFFFFLTHDISFNTFVVYLLHRRRFIFSLIIFLLQKLLFSRVHATLQPAPSVGPSVGPSVRRSVGNTLLFFVFLGRLELF